MTGIYRLEQIEHYFGDRRVLHIPELTIREGECLGIIGPSGAGKTTLLRILAMLDRPGAGSLRYRGETCPRDIPLEIRREVTLVFQRATLLDLSVAENVAYGLRVRGNTGDGIVQETMRELGIDHLADHPARNLSAGEMQRAAVARALVIRPRVLLLDEPTANLDPDNVAILERAIETARTRDGVTVVLVSHNLHQVCRLASAVGGLIDGELVEHGPARQVVNGTRDERLQAFIRGGIYY